MVLYFMNACSIMTGYFTVNNFKNYGLERGITNDSYLGAVGSVASILSAMRFIWSWATDYFSYKLVYGVLCLTQVILCFTM